MLHSLFGRSSVMRLASTGEQLAFTARASTRVVAALLFFTVPMLIGSLFFFNWELGWSGASFHLYFLFVLCAAVLGAAAGITYHKRHVFDTSLREARLSRGLFGVHTTRRIPFDDIRAVEVIAQRMSFIQPWYWLRWHYDLRLQLNSGCSIRLDLTTEPGQMEQWQRLIQLALGRQHSEIEPELQGEPETAGT